ncbi:MAG: MFS transporter [Planctomycetota bacterium]|nr:MFS transporter [Planctomycetota bacterium]
MLYRFPARCRPALRFDAVSNIGNGVNLVLFPIALVVLETILDAEVWHQAVLASFFFGSCLFGLLVTRLGTVVPMRLLVILPNCLMGLLLFGTLIPSDGASWFTFLIGATFLLKVFHQVAEMNMFRMLYPDTHRSAAVGLLRAVSAISGLAMTITSWWWFALWPQWYASLFCIMGLMLFSSAWYYSKIPVARKSMFVREDRAGLLTSFRNGCRIFFADRRFVLYQFGFALAGIANHIGLYLVPRVMREDAGASDSTIRFVAAVMPVLLLVMTAPLWGRYMDKKSPMTARGVFNVLQIFAFGFYALGGVTGQIWPLFLGGAIHALSNGGGAINWLTGSMYFAKPEHASLYNGIHVFLTGVRGFIGPPLAMFLFIETETIGSVTITGLGMGPWVFLVSAVLSLLGARVMFTQAKIDKGPIDDRIGGQKTANDRSAG